MPCFCTAKKQLLFLEKKQLLLSWRPSRKQSQPRSHDRHLLPYPEIFNIISAYVSICKTKEWETFLRLD